MNLQLSTTCLVALLSCQAIACHTVKHVSVPHPQGEPTGEIEVRFDPHSGGVAVELDGKVVERGVTADVVVLFGVPVGTHEVRAQGYKERQSDVKRVTVLEGERSEVTLIMNDRPMSEAEIAEKKSRGEFVGDQEGPDRRALPIIQQLGFGSLFYFIGAALGVTIVGGLGDEIAGLTLSEMITPLGVAAMVGGTISSVATVDYFGPSDGSLTGTIVGATLTQLCLGVVTFLLADEETGPLFILGMAIPVTVGAVVGFYWPEEWAPFSVVPTPDRSGALAGWTYTW